MVRWTRASAVLPYAVFPRRFRQNRTPRWASCRAPPLEFRCTLAWPLTDLRMSPAVLNRARRRRSAGRRIFGVCAHAPKQWDQRQNDYLIEALTLWSTRLRRSRGHIYAAEVATIDAFSRKPLSRASPPVHRADREGQLRVEGGHRWRCEECLRRAGSCRTTTTLE